MSMQCLLGYVIISLCLVPLADIKLFLCDCLCCVIYEAGNQTALVHSGVCGVNGVRRRRLSAVS